MEHEEIFDKICSKRFDKIEKSLEENHKEVMDILRGKDDCPGLVADVRGLKKIYKAIIGAVVFIFSAVVFQTIKGLWSMIFKS